MTTTAHLGLPYIAAAQAQKHVTHNEALRRLDAVVHLAVLDRIRTAPPTSPGEGDRHLVAAGATGAWAGHSLSVAVFTDGAWEFFAPRAGWCAWSLADDYLLVFDGAAWRDARNLPVTLDNATRIGVNTVAASPNLLSVRSNAALFSAIAAAGGGTGDVRLQLSRETSANVASVFFANAFSGRAEFGLVGSDAFRLKVSADGAAWSDALGIDCASGLLTMPKATALAGVLTPAQIAANQNDYAPAGHAGATTLRLSTDAARTLTGLAGGVDGLVKVLLNVGAFALTLSDADSASSAINRFAFGANLTLNAGQAALIWYDAAASRWKLVASSASLADGSVSAVKLDASTSAKQRELRGAVYAAPFDALAFSGLQVNGGMEGSQENGASSVTLTATGSPQTKYLIDGAMAAFRGSFVAAGQQVSDAPDGYRNSLKVTVSTAQASLGANDELSLVFPIEGVRAARLAFGTGAACALSLAFWIKAHRAGSYSGSLRNSAKTRSYPFGFAVAAADVWEFKTVTLAGDTTGTWLKDTGVGLSVAFAVAAGASRAGTAAAWTAGDLSGATSTTNGVAATSDTFQIAGLVVLPGLELPAPARAPLITRPHDAELALMKRYFEPIGAGCVGHIPGTSRAAMGVRFAVEKRAAPTLALSSSASGAIAQIGASSFTPTSISNVVATRFGAAFDADRSYADLTVGNAVCGVDDFAFANARL